MMAKQDQDLSELSKGIGDLKNIGGLRRRCQFDISVARRYRKGVDKTDGALQKRTKKAKILQNKCKAIAALCLIFPIILLVFNISRRF